jgi:glycosyltransferase involved in cell wall biosynthesis
MKKLIITQPYVPEYRRSFFENLITKLAESNIECRVAAGRPRKVQAARSDSIEAPWIDRVGTRSVGVLGKRVVLSGAEHLWRPADGVIVAHRGSSIETFRALSARRRKLKVGVWGHIANYTSPAHWLDQSLERLQLRMADHVFAYTPSGARFAEAYGAKSVTTVMNSVDTEKIRTAVAQITPEMSEAFSAQHDLSGKRVFAFVGGLDSSKRIDFLAATLDILWTSDPNIHVLVGGRGDQEHLLETARSRGQVTMLGFVGVHEKALISEAALALLMPGRIGLVAVEALALGLPVLTTDWPYHAPEADYLSAGTSLFSSANEVSAYARLMTGFAPTRTTDRNDWPFPTIEDMVTNFHSGVLTMMS